MVERVDQPQVFYTYEWALAVQRAYSATLRPLIFLAYDEQASLSGVAALATTRAGDQASFLCATTGDYCDFLSLPGQQSDYRVLMAGTLLGMLPVFVLFFALQKDFVVGLASGAVKG